MTEQCICDQLQRIWPHRHDPCPQHGMFIWPPSKALLNREAAEQREAERQRQEADAQVSRAALVTRPEDV